MDIPKIYVRKHGVINLGRQGENDVRQVVWRDVFGEWEAQFGAGKVQLAVTRPEDEAPYLANIDVADGEITWTITNAETAKVGDGSCELSYIVGDAVKKSQTWTTYVCPSLTGQEPGDPPEPYQSWVDKIIQETADLKIQGVPKGGTAGQFLGKKSDGDFDTEWMDVKAGVESVNGKTGAVELTAEDVGALPNTTEIPKPDWNENNENSANFVKNRTHYIHLQSSSGLKNFTINERTKWTDFRDSLSTTVENITLCYGIPYRIIIDDETYITTCMAGTTMMDGCKYFGFNLGMGYDVPSWNYGDGFELAGYVDTGYYGEGAFQGAIPLGTEVTGRFRILLDKTSYPTPPKRIRIHEFTYDFYTLDKHYLPSSTVLLDSSTSTLKSPTGDDITDNVKQIVKNGEPIVLARLTPIGTDDDGNLVYGSDKTYDELKAAYEAGGLLGVVPLYNTPLWWSMLELTELSYIPLTTINLSNGNFMFNIKGLSPNYSVDLGALTLARISVNISKNEADETEVNIKEVLPDMEEYFPNPDAINISLPQQYIINLNKAEDGTISSSTPFGEIVRCFITYINVGFDVFKDGKIGACDMGVLFPAITDTSDPLYGVILKLSKAVREEFSFTATTSRGVETVTVTNDGTNDVWTHEVKPFSTLSLPTVSSSDNGKILQVVNGEWTAVELTNANGVNF